MTNPGKTKTATPYTVTKREGAGEFGYDVDCRFCAWAAKAFDFRYNAVATGRAHIATAHPSAPKRVTVTA